METVETVNNELLDRWAFDVAGPVALHVSQRLLAADSVDGDGQIVFPPTYADIGYNVDTLSDGRKVATIDTVGSQANRLEPLFKQGGPFAELVPQLEIEINHDATVSVLDLAHRAADATVLASPGLAPKVTEAFKALRVGDAGPMCALAPTSLVFGVWDSRGETGEKRPRLVRSIIRAWDVEVLHTAAQFNSVWKKLDEKQQEELKREAKSTKVDLSEKGLADAPATFRKTKSPSYRDGAPNPEARVLGGVLVKGRIEREVTVNLVALRGLRGGDENRTRAVRRYLLGLTLLAATAEIDLFLREGCLLRYAGEDEEIWTAVPRRGEPTRVTLFAGRETILKYAQSAAEEFKPSWPKKEELRSKFDLMEAKKLLKRKTEEEATG
jgi:CRISPR-associated protein Csb1